MISIFLVSFTCSENEIVNLVNYLRIKIFINAYVIHYEKWIGCYNASTDIHLREKIKSFPLAGMIKF